MKSGVIGGQANQNEPVMVTALINENPRAWKESLILNLFEEQVADEILAITISPNPKKDCLVWTGNKLGTYTVKSRYNMVHSNITRTEPNRASCSFKPPRTLWTRIWSLAIPPKMKTFLWSLCQNAIPTRENLHKRKMLPNPFYPFCSTHMETTEHLFLLCKWTKKIWADPHINLISNPSYITRFDQWLMEIFEGRDGLPEKELVVAVLWNI